MGRGLDRIYRGEGCTYCAHTGFLGRTGVFEILLVNNEIRRIIMDGGSSNDVKAAAIREGMVTMRQDGLAKVHQGTTTLGEVMRNVSSLQ